MHDEAMGKKKRKKEKWLNLRISEMTTNKKWHTVVTVLGGLKAKDIYSPITQGQENVKSFSSTVLF